MNSVIPPWLHEPPDGPEPAPPVETRGQMLPLGQLSWQDFERLVLRLVRREGDIVECSVYGTPGQAQGGIDILATRAEQPALRVCYQCKKVAEFSPADIASAVDRFLVGKWSQDTREFVLCVSIPLESTQLQDEVDRQRTKLADRGIRFSTWDGAAAGGICERLKAHPNLVDDFFGRAWVENFNGRAAETSLGERLNGYELRKLRARLLSLYSVLFAQHDPGLHYDGDQRFDYRDRYVTADVIERTRIDIASVDSSTADLSMGESGSSGGMRSTTVAPSRGNSVTYETRKSVLEWLRAQRKCIVLGEPGYGKSAMVRYLALSLLQPEKLHFNTLDPNYFSCLPVWISFARFSAAVERQQGISVEDFFHTWLHQYGFGDVRSLFQRATRGGQVLLLVDGLDEAATEPSGREALDRIIAFLEACDGSLICTSRPQSYRTLGVPPAWAAATLTPLSDQKIEELAARWLDFLEPTAKGMFANETEESWGRRRAQAFLRVARDNPKTLELARNPLLCQSLIQLFRFSHQLPEARIAAYKQIVELLLSKHPTARAHAGGRSSPTDHWELGASDLNEILIRLAWAMQCQPGGSLSRGDCEQVCVGFLVDDTYGLGESPAKARRLAGQVVDQLAAHYGVLVERAPGEFNLLHLSIQEYLAAVWVARLSPEDQLEWMSRIWTSQAWRESLIAWFGVLGDRSDKLLASRASQRLAELGETSEWLRMQSLELRAEIATSDLGLPVSEARRIVEQVSREVETSPFVDLRTALARTIALGALGAPVKIECRAALRRWLPGYSSRNRCHLLRAFKSWKPTDALRTALLRAFRDEEILCRRAAVETFAAVFSDATETLSTLRWFAIHHVQPEVRAAALHGLASRSEWTEVATEAALASHGTACAELFMAVMRVKIQQGRQNDDDLNRILTLWGTDTVDYSIHREPADLLCKGWSQDARLRNAFVERLRADPSIVDVEMPLTYLVRCYPGDDEIADIVACAIERFGNHFFIRDGELWDALLVGFREHARVSRAVRTMLLQRRKQYERIFWDSRTATAMAVIGDGEARNDLLASYGEADLRGRYWIAAALLKGWSGDDLVQNRLREWAGGHVGMAAPLATWGKELIADVDQRHAWLRELARETASTREIGAIVALLQDVPDAETRRLAEELIDHPSVWYYHRMTLQGLYARAFPNEPRSIKVFEDALNDIDGPNPGSFADSFENVAIFSSRLLAAATPAPVDVRLAVATVLRERAVDSDTIAAITPSPFAEEDGAVRASCLIARARAARSSPDATEAEVQVLMSELFATGSEMDMRRRTALAALLELGAYERIVSAFVSETSTDWTHRLSEWAGRDAISIGAVVEHWNFLRPLLEAHNLKAELPIDAIVGNGYDALLEREPSLQQALDNYFETTSPGIISSAYFDAFARRLPTSASLRGRLLQTVCREKVDVACAAARVLAALFSSQQDIWPELSSRLGPPRQAVHYVADGVLGYLALGWPEGTAAAWVRELPADQRALQSPRNRVLFSVLLKDAVAAEAAAAELLRQPLESWRYRIEDTNVLRIWAKSDVSDSSLERWIVSDNPSLSLTAISLIASTRRSLEMHIDQLIERFNAQLMRSADAPEDGLNAATGQQTSWAVSVHSILKDWPRTAV